MSKRSEASKFSKSDWLVVGWVVFICFVCLLYVFGGFFLLSKIIFSEVTAAWAQAVGAVVGIYAATRIASSQERVNEQARADAFFLEQSRSIKASEVLTSTALNILGEFRRQKATGVRHPFTWVMEKYEKDLLRLEKIVNELPIISFPTVESMRLHQELLVSLVKLNLILSEGVKAERYTWDEQQEELDLLIIRAKQMEKYLITLLENFRGELSSLDEGGGFIRFKDRVRAR